MRIRASGSDFCHTSSGGLSGDFQCVCLLSIIMKATEQTSRFMLLLLALPLLLLLLFADAAADAAVVTNAGGASNGADNRISRQRGNILRNLTGTQSYYQNIVTSPLDASVGIRHVYRSMRDLYNKYVQYSITRDSWAGTIALLFMISVWDRLMFD